jgi:hypothetical protein
MNRLFAPAGVTVFSHGGHEFDVGPDGSVEVSDHVAAALRSHGFTQAAAPPSESVLVKRSDLLAALEKLGTAANPDATADLLATALAAAVTKEVKKTAPGDKPTLTIKPPAA